MANAGLHPDGRGAAGSRLRASRLQILADLLYQLLHFLELPLGTCFRLLKLAQRLLVASLCLLQLRRKLAETVQGLLNLMHLSTSFPGIVSLQRAQEYLRWRLSAYLHSQGRLFPLPSRRHSAPTHSAPRKLTVPAERRYNEGDITSLSAGP